MTWSQTTSAAEILYMVSETNQAYLHFIKVTKGGSAGERRWQWAESCRRRQEKVSGTAVEIQAGCLEHLPSVWPLWAGQEPGMLLSKTQREVHLCVCVWVCWGGGVPCSMLLKPEKNSKNKHKLRKKLNYYFFSSLQSNLYFWSKNPSGFCHLIRGGAGGSCSAPLSPSLLVSYSLADRASSSSNPHWCL